MIPLARDVEPTLRGLPAADAGSANVARVAESPAAVPGSAVPRVATAVPRAVADATAIATVEDRSRHWARAAVGRMVESPVAGHSPQANPTSTACPSRRRRELRGAGREAASAAQPARLAAQRSRHALDHVERERVHSFDIASFRSEPRPRSSGSLSQRMMSSWSPCPSSGVPPNRSWNRAPDRTTELGRECGRGQRICGNCEAFVNPHPRWGEGRARLRMSPNLHPARGFRRHGVSATRLRREARSTKRGSATDPRPRWQPKLVPFGVTVRFPVRRPRRRSGPECVSGRCSRSSPAM